LYELIQVKGDSYYIESPAKIGLVKLGDNEACVIDSGSDKDAGRKVRQVLDKNGWKLKAIYNTHSNADHIGGNKYLQGQSGCRIFAPAIECAFTNHTILEPSFLYGGFPPKALRHKFLMAKESSAETLTDEALPVGMERLSLPGHFFNMTGFKSADNVAYIADSLFSEETLKKYRINFIYDVGAYIDTLKRVKELEADFFVPSHAEVTSDIRPLADANIGNVLAIADDIVELCREPKSFEPLLKELFDRYSLSMSFDQYVLAGSTVRSYLAWLLDGGRVETLFEDNLMLWRAV
jgi:glyoxylase-like metal-dependent hydrolase (beta-lactamase superfamily II)